MADTDTDANAIIDRLAAIEAALANLAEANHDHDGYASAYAVDVLETTVDRLGQRLDRSLTTLGHDIDDVRDIANRADRRR